MKKSEYQRLEDVIGCKWSTSVLLTIEQGKHRPGEIEKSIENISKKVLSERFRKLTDYGLLTKKQFQETILHTEYHLTMKGKKLLNIISQINQLDSE